jgi:adenosylhomocysteinase
MSRFQEVELQQVVNQFAIRDLSLAAFGAREVALAEKEMPALMALRNKHVSQAAESGHKLPLHGAKILGSIHMTIQTAVLVDTLIALGAEVSWTSCNIFSTQDHAAAYLADKGVKVFAWKGQTNADSEECLHAQIEALPEANMILDDGGDLTQLVLERFPNLAGYIYGVSEETTTGVHRLEKLLAEAKLQFPAINVNDSVTKSKNDNKYGCRHSLNDAIKRATDMLLSGKKAIVVGYGDVGKGSAMSLRQEGMIVRITEIDPICAMQACMDGFEVVSFFENGNPNDALNTGLLRDTDLIVTTTGNYQVVNADVLEALAPDAVVCNIGHFDNEIDTGFLREAYEWQEVKPQVHYLVNPATGHSLILLSEGRLVNLGNATGHPSRIMDGSFANQVLAQISLYQDGLKHKENGTVPAVTVKVLPKHLDEEVARCMVEGFRGVITQLTVEQADYIGVSQSGPFKPETYRY